MTAYPGYTGIPPTNCGQPVLIIANGGAGPSSGVVPMPVGSAPLGPAICGGPLPFGAVPLGPASGSGPLPFGPAPLGPAICGGPLPFGTVAPGPAPGTPNAFASGLQNLPSQPMYSSAAPIQSWMAGVAEATTGVVPTGGVPTGGASMVHAGTDTNFQGPGHRLPWILDGLYGAPVRFSTVRRGSS